VRGPDEPLNAALEPIGQVNVDTGSSVSFSFSHLLLGRFTELPASESEAGWRG
jgi:hypothetical protein